jgi:hypothetical protein
VGVCRCACSAAACVTLPLPEEPIKTIELIDSASGLLDTTSEVVGNDVYDIISEPFVELSSACLRRVRRMVRQSVVPDLVERQDFTSINCPPSALRQYLRNYTATVWS